MLYKRNAGLIYSVNKMLLEVGKLRITQGLVISTNTVYKAGHSDLLFSSRLICWHKLTDCLHTFIRAFYFWRTREWDLPPTNQSKVKWGALRDYLQL